MHHADSFPSRSDDNYAVKTLMMQYVGHMSFIRSPFINLYIFDRVDRDHREQEIVNAIKVYIEK